MTCQSEWVPAVLGILIGWLVPATLAAHDDIQAQPDSESAHSHSAPQVEIDPGGEVRRETRYPPTLNIDVRSTPIFSGRAAM